MKVEAERRIKIACSLILSEDYKTLGLTFEEILGDLEEAVTDYLYIGAGTFQSEWFILKGDA